ncbi:MAG: hypothetical protein AAFR84_16880, partial [Pseudomonadota bacterium]
QLCGADAYAVLSPRPAPREFSPSPLPPTDKETAMNQWFKDPPEHPPFKAPKHLIEDIEAERTRLRINFQRMFVLAGATLATIASIGLSFVGTAYNLERDGGDTFATLGSALSISLVVGAMQFIGWWVLLETRSYPTGLRKFGGALMTTAFLFFGYGTSSYFNYSSITAPSATVIYRSDEVQQRIAIMDVLRARLDTAKQLLPLVSAERAAGCSAAELEATKGIYSGSAGTGLVSGALDGICQRAAETERALIAALATAATTEAEARAILERLETGLTAVHEPILKRERYLTQEIRNLDAVMRDLAGARMTESVEAFFATLVTSVAALGPTGVNGFAARQNTALAALRQGFEERLPIIEDLVAKIDAVDVPQVTLDDRPSVHELMLYSVEKHPQNVLLALGLDSFCAFMILVLLLKEPPKRRGPSTADADNNPPNANKE